MKIRKMRLEEGWYPKNDKDILTIFDSINKSFNIKNFQIDEKKIFNLAILPHAGWFFTQNIIFNCFKILAKESIDMVVLIGGHQDQNGTPLILNYDYFDTPLGQIKGEEELVNKLINIFKMKEESDFIFDNTIEIFLPFIKYFFPNSLIVAYYSPANDLSFLISDFIYNYLIEKKLKFICIGSADLTHYGPNYYFTPAGIGKKSFEWAKENDYKLINFAINLDYISIIESYQELKFTCSPNSIISIINFAKLLKKDKGFLLEYYNSYYKMASSSFVGYASIIY